MEAPTDVAKLIEQVQLLLAQSAAQQQRIAALEAEHAALQQRIAVLEAENAAEGQKWRIGTPIGVEQQQQRQATFE